MTTRAKGLACLALVGLATAAARPAHASGHMPSITEGDLTADEVLAVGAPLFLIPSEAGARIIDGRGQFVLGWSGQLPIREHHHIVLGLTLDPSGGSHEVEARVGYRYGGLAPLFGGLGAALDGAGVTWSPELGINLLPWQELSKSGGVHLLVRGEIAPALNQFRAVTFLLGWTIL
ncbi:MAG TPA: hypothetical protein VKZ18_04200 [Polyangia bacterium]|nr:hypothetical protein [Polyangia bacterium]